MNIERFAFPTFILFIVVKAFSGPIGMITPLVNYSAVLCMLILLIYKWVRTLFVMRSLIILSFLLLFYIIIGTLNGSFVQALFGVYIFIPFLFSIAYAEVIYERLMHSSIKYFIFFGASCILGVVYVNAFGAPWLGSVQDIGGYSKVLSRDWTAGGLLRNPGFTGASFDAATLMLISFFIVLYRLRDRHYWIGYIMICIVPIYPIYLTTTKTTIITYFILSLLTVLPTMITNIASKIMIFFSVCFSYYFMMMADGHVKYDESNTLLQRMFDTWPKAMGLLKDNFSFLIGKGVGGIGTPSLLFSPLNYNPADNALVYLYVIGGVVSVSIIIIFIIKFILSSFYDRKDGRFYYLFALCIFTGGVTYNLFESVFYAPFSGVLVGIIFNSKYCSIKKYKITNKVHGHLYR